MKRGQLIRHLSAQGCVLKREGGRHSIFQNTASGKTSAVPRHSEIKDLLIKIICKDLEIPLP